MAVGFAVDEEALLGSVEPGSAHVLPSSTERLVPVHLRCGRARSDWEGGESIAVISLDRPRRLHVKRAAMQDAVWRGARQIGVAPEELSRTRRRGSAPALA